jgi:site-specific recombinase XerD
MRLSSTIPRYLSHCESERRLSLLSVAAYRADLKDFVFHVGEVKDLADIGGDDLKEYLVVLNGRSLSVATVKRRFATLQGFFKWAVDDCGIDNPFNHWKPKIKKPKRLPRALMRTELANILSLADQRRKGGLADETTFLVLVTMAATGVRVGELCAITLEDTSPDGSTFRIKGKGSRDRVVYISNTWLKAAIARWRDKRGDDGRAALFAGRSNNRLQPASLRGRLKRLAKASGATRRVTPHMLRHTAATLLIEEGVDIRIVQRLLGHASIATTEIYTHVADEALKRSLEKADVVGTVVPRTKR